MTEEYRTEMVYAYTSDAAKPKKGRLRKCFIYADRRGFIWYCTHNGSIVNKTYSAITHGINIEDQVQLKTSIVLRGTNRFLQCVNLRRLWVRSPRIKQLLKQLSMLDLICFSFTAPVELIAATLDEIQARTTEEEFIQICNLIMN